MEKIYRTPPYKFCPFCKGNLTQEDPFRQKCMECGFIMYHNSSPCAGAVPVDKNNRVLLAKRGIEPFKHGWNIIGGFLNYGENPMDGLKREVKEETNLDFIPTKLFLKTYQNDREMHRYFGNWEGAVKLQEIEIADAGWFTYGMTRSMTFSFDYKFIIESLHKEKYL